MQRQVIVEESPSVKLAKKLIESKRQTEIEAKWAYKNDPKMISLLKRLKKENEDRRIQSNN
jgi:hypothetical protein